MVRWLPFADASFDVVLSFDVFEHIPDSDAHLREVSRVLKPGGRYLLQTPNKWTNTVFETIRWRSFSSWRHDHCSLHSYSQLQRRFERNGFDVRFADIPVVTAFFRRKLRHYLGGIAPLALAVGNPDRLPLPMRTNFYLVATQALVSGGQGRRGKGRTASGFSLSLFTDGHQVPPEPAHQRAGQRVEHRDEHAVVDRGLPAVVQPRLDREALGDSATRLKPRISSRNSAIE